MGGAPVPACARGSEGLPRRLHHPRYKLETLFVDPPRAGLDATCRRLAGEFGRVVYVSCNPDTLARDVRELSATHEVTRLAAFDQFPYTPHLECGVVLRAKADRHRSSVVDRPEYGRDIA
jgi:hypothetical protein